jgi:hemolysin activation/secretion protein
MPKINRKTTRRTLTLLLCWLPFGAPVVAAEATPSATTDTSTPSQERFNISEYRVLNNSVLPPIEVERAVYPFLGPQKTFDDIQSAKSALEKAYKNAGYSTVWVDIPEQSIDAGIVRLKVTEGRLDRVRVSGARFFAGRTILEATPSLSPGQVPHFPDVQRELNQVNSASRDRSVTPVLRSGRTPGTVDVELKMRDELPLHGGAEFNNRYTADTSQTRASVNLSYDNLWGRFHSLALQYQTAPQERQEARVIAATYAMPLTASSVLAFYGVDTNSDVATVGTLSVLGRGRIYGTRYTLRLPGAPRYFHNLTFGADYKDFKEDVRLTTDVGLRTPIQYANWSLSYGGTMSTERRLTSLNVSANFGIRGFANDALEFENKRFKARPDYFYLRADAAHERPLIFGTRLALRVAAQFTTEPLISNEQFAIGGMDSVRGYLESEELGDLGFSGSVELRTPSLGAWPRHVSQLYLFAFCDAGVVSIIDPLPGQARRSDLSSWGLGFRFNGFGGLQAILDWAYPLVPAANTDAGDSRLDFRVRYDF